ncbi:DNA cytosine methyltransferase [Infirmifilum sp.]|uniref:DNA cytosine methyltransferase n=1 Tax=Infirmifilum sp. TaxID=2856575 RepID=UPI003D11A9DA
MTAFSVVSLFSGAGGLDWGFAQDGRYRILFANDVLEPATRTYARNFGLRHEVCRAGEVTEAEPGTVLACDVQRVSFSRLRDAGADLVLGGPPCQDFSIARGPEWDRRGIEVARGRLYAHFVRALAELQPKVFVFENVPGLVSANRGLAYRVILEDFRNLKLRWPEVKRAIPGLGDPEAREGYEIVYAGVADFSRLGVPQRRERLLVVGVRRDLVGGDLTRLWRLRARLERALGGEGWLFRKYPLTPLEVFEGRRLDELGEKYREVMEEWRGVWEEVGTETALRWKREVWDKLSFDVVKDYLAVNGAGRVSEEELEEALRQHETVLRELGYWGVPVSSLRLPDGTTDPPSEDATVAERMRRIPPGENHEFVRGTEWEVEGRGISLIYRRIHPLKPAYTVVAYGGGGTHGYHYERSRATLTLRERARLQTFPDNFLFSGSRTEVRAQIGEAVPPLVSKRLAEALAEVLEELSHGF